MKTNYPTRLLASLLLLALFGISCNRNEDYIFEETDGNASFLRISVSEDSEMYDGYAGYCNDGTLELFHITNNTEFLDPDNLPSDFDSDDFLLSIGITGTDTICQLLYNYSYENDGQIFNNLIAQTTNTLEDFEYINGRVKGKLSGQFDIDELSDPAYDVTFSSEVVELPSLCE
jgi:hypothetical protein